MPVGQLVDIICSDELNVRSEEQVFNAVMAWLKYNVADRRQHLSQVLQHVRLPLLSPKFLVGTVGSDLLVRSDEACRDLVDEAKNYLLLPQERPLMQGPRTRPRKPTRRGEVCKFSFTMKTSEAKKESVPLKEEVPKNSITNTIDSKIVLISHAKCNDKIAFHNLPFFEGVLANLRNDSYQFFLSIDSSTFLIENKNQPQTNDIIHNNRYYLLLVAGVQEMRLLRLNVLILKRMIGKWFRQ